MAPLLHRAAINSGRNESSWERKFEGTKVPRNFRSAGTKVLENEKSRERKFPIGTIRSWEPKVLGTKSPVTDSLTGGATRWLVLEDLRVRSLLFS